MNILNQQQIYQQNNVAIASTLYWQNTVPWQCKCGVTFQKPFSGCLRHLCEKCGKDVSKRLILSKSMKLVEKSTNFYNIESEDVMSWAELNWIVASGGLSKSFLAGM